MREYRRNGIVTLAVAGALLSSGGLRAAIADAGSLIDAVKAGNLTAVKKLLAGHRNPNDAEADGTTALYWGVQ